MFTNRIGKARCGRCVKDWKIRRVKKSKTRSKNWLRPSNARFVTAKDYSPNRWRSKSAVSGLMIMFHCRLINRSKKSKKSS